MKPTQVFFSGILCLLSLTVSAGAPGPLCDAVQSSKYILELEITPSLAKYAESYAQKNWAPKESELKKIMQSAKIVKVHKGDFKVGETFKGFDFLSGSEFGSGSAWKNFFAQKKITVLMGDGLDGWVWDGGDGEVVIARFHYEKHHKSYQSAVLKCLK